MPKLVSKKPCFLTLNGVTIKPADSELSVDEYKKVSVHEDFKYLVSTGDIVVIPEITESKKVTGRE